MKYVGCFVPNEVVSKYIKHVLVSFLMITSKIFNLGGHMMVMPSQVSMFDAPPNSSRNLNVGPKTK
jgi:hypothetical protein